MTIRQKISLDRQIALAVKNRDALEGLAQEGVEMIAGDLVRDRLDVMNGTVLTLTFLQTYETEFRAFMAQRSKGMGR